MSTALVVYESLFGNAQSIAIAIGDALAERLTTKVIEVRSAPLILPPEVDLLVVGGPNHATTMPGPTTRAQARERYGADVRTLNFGLREWLTQVRVEQPRLAATFDTRIDHPRILRSVDHATHLEAKLLRRKGFRLISPAAHFLVSAAAGPLHPNALVDARAWGTALAERATTEAPLTHQVGRTRPDPDDGL